MKSALFAAATIMLAASPALAKDDVAEPSGLGFVTAAIGALIAVKAMRRK